MLSGNRMSAHRWRRRKWSSATVGCTQEFARMVDEMAGCEMRWLACMVGGGRNQSRVRGSIDTIRCSHSTADSASQPHSVPKRMRYISSAQMWHASGSDCELVVLSSIGYLSGVGLCIRFIFSCISTFRRHPLLPPYPMDRQVPLSRPPRGQ